MYLKQFFNNAERQFKDLLAAYEKMTAEFKKASEFYSETQITTEDFFGAFAVFLQNFEVHISNLSVILKLCFTLYAFSSVIFTNAKEASLEENIFISWQKVYFFVLTLFHRIGIFECVYTACMGNRFFSYGS